jgi:hypothetical protein
MTTQLTNKELRDEINSIFGNMPQGYFTGKTFIKIKGADYLIADIINALTKGTGVKCIK